MTVISFLKKTYLLSFVLLIIIGGNFPSTAQLGLELQLDPTRQNHKWDITQKWDSEASAWGDTSSINCITFNDELNPVEFITLQSDSNGVFTNKSKTVITYENNNVRKLHYYSWLADSNKYSGTPDNIAIYSYTGDDLTRVELSTKPFIGYSAFGAQYAPMADIVVEMDIGLRYENSKVMCDSVKGKIISISDDAKALVSVLLPTFKLDTSWNEITRGEYTYSGDICIATKYAYNTDSSKNIMNGKDSAIFRNEKIATLYSFKKDSTGEYTVLSSKEEYTYDGSDLTQIVRMNPDGDQWVNYDRAVYFYTPWVIKTKTKNDTRKANDISAVLSGRPGAYALHLSLNKPSAVSVSILDLQGRITGKFVSQKRYSAGLHSIPINTLSPGKYICNIHLESGKMAVPLNIVR